MRTQSAWFNLQRVFSLNDVTPAQRWFSHAGARPSLTHQQSLYGPEVIAPAVTAKTLTSARGEAYLLKILLPPANHACRLLTLPKVWFHVGIFLRPTFWYKQFILWNNTQTAGFMFVCFFLFLFFLPFV